MTEYDVLEIVARRLLGRMPQHGEVVRMRHTLRKNGMAVYRKRKSPIKRAPVTARKMTSALAKRIRAYEALNPTMSQREIGAHFGVDGGRVSEALNGEW